MQTLREHLLRTVGRDLRACFADFCGYQVLTPDQERHVELLESKSRVIAMGGASTGKSFVQGVAAAILVATSCPSKALFGGPKLEQAMRLSWLHLQNAVLRSREMSRLYTWQVFIGGERVKYIIAREDEMQNADVGIIGRSEKPLSLSRFDIGTSEWYPGGKTVNPDWYAVCMALSDRNQAATVKGMLHGGRVLVVLDELEGIASEVRDVLSASTHQENSHFWMSFNPVSRHNAAGRLWSGVDSDCRVHYSALRCAEWQERAGVKIPGLPTLQAIGENWKGRESDPMYYTYVLGEFPPQNLDWVVVPESWSVDVVNCVAVPSDRDREILSIGVDTGWGGAAETVICGILGRVVLPLRCYAGLRDVPKTAGLVQMFINDVKREHPDVKRVVIAIDVIGTGGAGVYDLLRERGFSVVAIQGGSSSVEGVNVPDLYANLITWGWWEIREHIRRTREKIKTSQDVDTFEISLPDDRVLREQLSRGYRIRGDRKIELESKEKIISGGGRSPDRADALAMAILARIVADRRSSQEVRMGVVSI